MRCHQSPTICHSHNNAVCQVQVTTVEKNLLKFHMFHELIIHAQTQHANIRTAKEKEQIKREEWDISYFSSEMPLYLLIKFSTSLCQTNEFSGLSTQ